jgi:uncharacterized DUF497 family protein
MDEEARRFEWDERKRLLNIDKHGIDFRRAMRAFRDPQRVEYASRGDHLENRIVTIGLMDTRIIAVIYTVRGANMRIISARAADRWERKLWNENTS